MKTIFLLKKLITIYYYLLLLAFGIGLVFFPMGLVLKPMFNMKPFGQNLTLDFSSTKEIILFALVLILAYLYVKAIYFLKCCLKDLFEGNYFTNLVIANLKKVGIYFIACALGIVILQFSANLILMHQMKISFDFFVFFLFIMGIFFMFLSEAFAKGSLLKAENDLTI